MQGLQALRTHEAKLQLRDLAIAVALYNYLRYIDERMCVIDYIYCSVYL
jgi:hypothetical protein